METVIIDATLEFETDRAYRFNCDGDLIWIGKSIIGFVWDPEEEEITLPKWKFDREFPNG